MPTCIKNFATKPKCNQNNQSQPKHYESTTAVQCCYPSYDENQCSDEMCKICKNMSSTPPCFTGDQNRPINVRVILELVNNKKHASCRCNKMRNNFVGQQDLSQNAVKGTNSIQFNRYINQNLQNEKRDNGQTKQNSKQTKTDKMDGNYTDNVDGYSRQNAYYNIKTDDHQLKNFNSQDGYLLQNAPFKPEYNYTKELHDVQTALKKISDSLQTIENSLSSENSAKKPYINGAIIKTLPPPPTLLPPLLSLPLIDSCNGCGAKKKFDNTFPNFIDPPSIKTVQTSFDINVESYKPTNNFIPNSASDDLRSTRQVGTLINLLNIEQKTLSNKRSQTSLYD